MDEVVDCRKHIRLTFIAIHKLVSKKQQEVSTKTARESQDLKEIKDIQ
jgi:hypothetical protein